MEEKEKIFNFICIPEREFYYNEDSFWGSYRIETNYPIPNFKEGSMSELFGERNKLYSGSLSGNMQRLNIGEEYIIEGKLSCHKKYGYSINPTIVKQNIPSSTKQQLLFLKSLITEKQANTLIEAYPNIIQDIVNGKDDFDFNLMKGITKNNFEKIKDKVIDNFIIADILSLLSPLGISYDMIKKISNTEKNPVLLKQKLTENPYILTTIKGLGFKKVDDLALKLNPDLSHSKFRAIAFMKYHLKDVGESIGHAFVSLGELQKEFNNNVPQCMDLFDDIIKEQKENPTFLHVEDNSVGYKKYYDCEKTIMERLQYIANTPFESIIEQKDIDNGIKIANELQGFEFDENQIKIINNACRSKVTIISGLGGTSKSTTSRGILNAFSQAGLSISCCALSAKASIVISESTGFSASTIHRLFGIGMSKEDGDDGILRTDVLFIDECSMINDYLFMYMLTHILPNTIVIMVGDDKQLPAIGCGNLLGELLVHGSKIKNVNSLLLTKIYRQAQDSGIIHDANIIRSNENPIGQLKCKMVSGVLKDMFYMFFDTKEAIHKEALDKYFSSIQKYGIDNVAMVVPRKSACLNSCETFNNEIQDRLLKNEPYIDYGKQRFRLGAKVMQIENRYEKCVVNGDSGTIIKIEENQKGIVVDFGDNLLVRYTKGELKDLMLSYAITIHKKQGDSSDVIIGVIDKSHYMLLDSCLLYTLLTRAKKRCMLIGEPFAFHQCIRTNKQINRQTYYKEFIHE